MPIEAVTLDIYGTLFDISPVFQPATEKILAEEGIDTDTKSFSDIVTKEILSRLDRYEGDNSVEFQPIRVIWEESFRTAFASFGVEGDAERAVDVWFDLFHAVDPFPDVPEAVNEISARYKVAIVSDADDEMLMPAWERIGLPVEHVFTSEAAKSYKIQSDSKIFDLAFNTLNVEPHLVVHVGDARADIIGAINAGAKAIWLSRKGQSWEDRGITPNATAKNFAEVVALLSKM